MSTFALVHGAWHGAWVWERLRPELEARGHTVLAPELPGEELGALFSDYAAVVLRALDEAGDDVVLVGHSLGGLTVPLVAAARAVRRMVLIAALLPEPDRSFREQVAEDPTALLIVEGVARDAQGREVWVDADAAVRALYADCEPADAAAAVARLRPQARSPYAEPCPLERWPNVPCEYILCTEDATVSPEWARRTVPARLGIVPRELTSGHSPMLARPAELAALLS